MISGAGLHGLREFHWKMIGSDIVRNMVGEAKLPWPNYLYLKSKLVNRHAFFMEMIFSYKAFLKCDEGPIDFRCLRHVQKLGGELLLSLLFIFFIGLDFEYSH